MNNKVISLNSINPSQDQIPDISQLLEEVAFRLENRDHNVGFSHLLRQIADELRLPADKLNHYVKVKELGGGQFLTTFYDHQKKKIIHEGVYHGYDFKNAMEFILLTLDRLSNFSTNIFHFHGKENKLTKETHTAVILKHDSTKKDKYE